MKVKKETSDNYMTNLVMLFKQGNQAFATPFNFIAWLFRLNYFVESKRPIFSLYSKNGLKKLINKVRAINYIQ